jgi:N-acetylmuramoyl-L-alanine amidase
VAKGVDPRKVIFASIHTDALFNERLQGTMIYIPGARYRRDSESYGSSTYGRFAEYREHPNAASTESERRRDEALSRNFAEMLVDALGDHRPPITVNRTGDPIRSQIRQSGGKVYVPAVLRNNQIPAKILVETANICSSSDCRDLSDPSWREGFAEALVTAIRNYYN